MSRSKLIAANALVTVIAILFGYALCEAGYRLFQFYNYAIKADYPVATTDVRQDAPSSPDRARSLTGPFTPGKPFTFSYYNGAGQRVLHHVVHVNNLGWVSRFDYSVARQPREFRIAMVGASLTASTNNALPWPDLLQDMLNDDKELLTALNVDRISVLNLGAPGASLQFMAFPLAQIAARFAPDMIAVNFSTDNLSQRDYSVSPAQAAAQEEKAAVDSTTAPAPQRTLTIDGVELSILCPHESTDENDDSCMVSPLWYVPPGLHLSPDKLNAIKRQAAWTLARSRILFAKRPLLLLDLLHRMRASGAIAAPDSSSLQIDSSNADFEVGLESFEYIRSMGRRTLFLHVPTYNHLIQVRFPNGKTGNETLADFSDFVRPHGFDIISMEQYLPTEKGDVEWRRWYNLPFDGHFSDVGARLYARAVATVIHQNLLGTEDTQSTSELLKLRKAFSRGNNLNVIAIVDRMLTSDPGNPELLGMRARADKALGHTEAVEQDLTRMLDLPKGTLAATERDRILQQRGEVRVARHELDAAVADFTAVIRDGEGNQKLYTDRGAALLADGNAKSALADFEQALALGPPTASLHFQVWQASVAIGDNKRAIDAANAAISMEPSNADLFYCRGYSYAAENRYREAIADFTKALALRPDMPAARQALSEAKRELDGG